MTLAIETHGLSKTYKGKVRALSDFSLQVPQGSCFGLLGPNGAGKSTLIKSLLTIIRPTSGTAQIRGIDVRQKEARRSVGYLPEGHRFPRYQTGRGILKYFGRLAGLSGAELQREIEEKLELVDMTERAKDRLSKYSKGMNQRIGLAQALLGNPELVFLDEPTDGVDPMGRKEIRDIIRKACDAGTTVFLNSHILAEVEMICDRVAIIDKGSLITQGSIDEIVGATRDQKEGLSVEFTTSALEPTQWQSLVELGAKRDAEDQAKFVVPVPNRERVTDLIDQLRGWEASIYSVRPIEAQLEDAFIGIIEDMRSKSKGAN